MDEQPNGGFDSRLTSPPPTSRVTEVSSGTGGCCNGSGFDNCISRSTGVMMPRMCLSGEDGGRSAKICGYNGGVRPLAAVAEPQCMSVQDCTLEL